MESILQRTQTLRTTTHYFERHDSHHSVGSNAGKVWVCPHRILDYSESTRSMETTEVQGCGGNGRLFVNGRYGNSLLSRWLIMRAPQGLAPSTEEGQEALRSLDAPICPHLRLNDPILESIYRLDYQRLRWKTEGIGVAPDCRCRMCSWKRPRTEICQYYGTRILFTIKPKRRGLETLNFITWGILRDVWGSIDGAWISQLSSLADFEEHERAWQAIMVECWRKVGHQNYSAF